MAFCARFCLERAEPFFTSVGTMATRFNGAGAGVTDGVSGIALRGPANAPELVPSNRPRHDPAKETLAWKMARPLMKTELYIRRFVQGWKAA